MKKILIIAFLVIGMVAGAQVRFIDKEYFTTSIAVDGGASMKEGGIDIVGEIELVSYWKYVKVNVQSFAVLYGGYTDVAGGFGINLTPGIFDKWRLYAGGRLGLISRGQYIFPLVGSEVGVDYNFRNSNMFVGLRGTYDYRKDFQFSGAPASMRYSSFIRIGTKF